MLGQIVGEWTICTPLRRILDVCGESKTVCHLESLIEVLMQSVHSSRTMTGTSMTGLRDETHRTGGSTNINS